MHSMFSHSACAPAAQVCDFNLSKAQPEGACESLSTVFQQLNPRWLVS